MKAKETRDRLRKRGFVRRECYLVDYDLCVAYAGLRCRRKYPVEIQVYGKDHEDATQRLVEYVETHFEEVE